MRNELSKLLSDKNCDACDGSRLRKESRNIFIENTPINQITEMRINESLEFVSELNLIGNKKRFLKKYLKKLMIGFRFLRMLVLDILPLIEVQNLYQVEKLKESD